MKKTLLAALTASFLASSVFANGLSPQEMIKDVPFTQNAKGTVIFKTVKDLLTEFNDYAPDDNRSQVISENPLVVRLTNIVNEGQNPDVTQVDAEHTLIYAVSQIFAHTKVNKMTLIINFMQLKDYMAGKYVVDKNIKPLKYTITRKHALAVLKKYGVSSFDDLTVSADTATEDETIGESPSKAYFSLLKDDRRHDIANALVGKKDKPWYEGGNLQGKTLAAWDKGSTPNKLASAQTIINALLVTGHVSFPEELTKADDFKPYATRMMRCINTKAAFGDGDTPVLQAGVACAAAIGILVK